MSWVINVVLLYGLREEYITDKEDEDVTEYIGVSPCLTRINGWLREHGWVELIDLTSAVVGMERHGFEANIWGAALNFLDITAFLRCVKSQEWREPENVQLLLKDQLEEKFTLLHLSDIDETGKSEYCPDS